MAAVRSAIHSSPLFRFPEPLLDGAAAQYGSDAISGVINIILDNAPTGGEFSVTGGQYHARGAPLIQTDLSYGTRPGSDGGFVRVAVEAKYHDRADSSADPLPSVLPLVNGQADARDAALDHVIAGDYGRSNRDKIVDSSYDAELPVSDAFTLYSFSTYSYRDVRRSGARAAWRFTTTDRPAQPDVLPRGA